MSPTDALDYPGSPTDRYLVAGEIRDALHAANDSFFQCFRQHARAGVDASDVGVTFVIGRDGRGSDVRPELGDAPPELGACLTQAIEAIDFGEHDGDPLEAAYPLVYQVDRRGARITPYPVVFTRPAAIRLPLLQLPPDLGPGEIRMLELILTHDAAPGPEPGAPAETDEAAEPATPGPASERSDDPEAPPGG